MSAALLRRLLAFALATLAAPAFAASYAFPSSLPAGCSGGGGNYTCGALSLGYNDTITISTPTTVTINGAFSTNTSQINGSGPASNLTLVVNGAMTVGYQTRINANVTATSINDTNGQVSFGGSLATTTGSITIGYASTVAGNLGSTSGAIGIASTAQVAGQVNCSCALTVGYQARITGNVSATSVSDSNGQVSFGGSVATSGSFTLGYASTVAGGFSSSNGSINLGGTSRVAQCVQSTGAGPGSITLGYQAVATAGVCCGALGSCTSSCVVNNSGGAMPALCGASSPNPGGAGRFNAFDSSTASGNVSGVIRTKVAGTSFTLAAVALNSAGNSLAPAFTGSVRVELLNSSDSSGPIDASTGCRSTWSAASGTTSSTLSFATGDAGRKNITLTVTNAWPDARVRISYPATGTPTAVGCSNDPFAVRPDRFVTLSASDGDFGTTGLLRPLNNTATVVHKAGRPFTVRAWAQGSTGATTSNYTTGAPTALPVTVCCSQTPGVASVSGSSFNNGELTAIATYSEAGSFLLGLEDAGFAAVDAGDGSTLTERTITTPVSSRITVGRFVPDHFELIAPNSPQVLASNSSSCSAPFTYLGQRFGYAPALRPQATVLARNAANATTTNYAMAALKVKQDFTHSHATPSMTAVVTPPQIADNGNGTASLTAQASDALTMDRPLAAPLAPFNTSITLTWTAEDDSGGAGSIVTTPAPQSFALPFNRGPGSFRFGVLKLGSAYGSELVNLAVPLETQHWNGNSFVASTDDDCTTLPTSSLALGNYRSNLAACETAPGPGSVTFIGGRALLRMRPPGNGNAGSVDGRINLGHTATGQQCSAVGAAATNATAATLPWLQGKWGSATGYDADPSARFSFGQYRSPLIHLREVY